MEKPDLEKPKNNEILRGPSRGKDEEPAVDVGKRRVGGREPPWPIEGGASGRLKWAEERRSPLATEGGGGWKAASLHGPQKEGVPDRLDWARERTDTAKEARSTNISLIQGTKSLVKNTANEVVEIIDKSKWKKLDTAEINKS